MEIAFDELRGMTARTPAMRQIFLDVAEAYYTDIIGDRLDRLVDALADVTRDEFVDRLIGLGIEPSDDLVDEFFAYARAVGRPRIRDRLRETNIRPGPVDAD